MLRTRRPTVHLAPAIALLVLAFALGSIGTATAAGLTKGTVKKIAAKVVAKQAPRLSVKHAATADSASIAANAEKLGGQTAAQLGVRPIVYTLPQGASYPSLKTWALDSAQLAAGTYVASFHAIIETASTFAECQLENDTQDEYPLDVYLTASPSHVPTLNGTGLVTVAPGDTFLFRCAVGATWEPAYDAHLTLTPVASATTGNLLTLP